MTTFTAFAKTTMLAISSWMINVILLPFERVFRKPEMEGFAYVRKYVKKRKHLF